MRYPLEIIYDDMDWADEETQVSRMMHEMKITYKTVEVRRRKEKEKEEEKKNKFQPQEFKKDDTVYIYRPKRIKGVAGKLWLNWVGPYKVVDRIGQGKLMK